MDTNEIVLRNTTCNCSPSSPRLCILWIDDQRRKSSILQDLFIRQMPRLLDLLPRQTKQTRNGAVCDTELMLNQTEAVYIILRSEKNTNLVTFSPLIYTYKHTHTHMHKTQQIHIPSETVNHDRVTNPQTQTHTGWSKTNIKASDLRNAKSSSSIFVLLPNTTNTKQFERELEQIVDTQQPPSRTTSAIISVRVANNFFPPSPFDF